jgi:GNAT superfamily N-acetyltransferase
MDDRSKHPTGNGDCETKAIIRVRRKDEMDACVRILADVHAADGYPLLWPEDPAEWLSPDTLLTAWVAEKEGILVGHVALCSAVGDSSAPLWSTASGLPPDRIAVIAKLFVSPRARGRGLGAALLGEACMEARRRGLLPALEVLDHDRSAIALYERTGWRRVASAPAPWAQTADGQASLFYYFAPDSASR